MAAISEVGEENDSDLIVRSTVALAHSLSLPVIAEGIECPYQLQRLRSLGCDFGQGYLFSPPLSELDTRALLARWISGEVAELGAAA